MTKTYSSPMVALLMVLSMLFISINDNFIKMIAHELPPAQILAFRGMLAVSIFVCLIFFSGMPLLPKKALSRANIGRGVLEAIASGCIVVALGLIPISAVAMLSWSVPIFSTILGATVLKERVGPIRWLSVFIGFIGVIFITNPTASDFSWAYLLPIICAIAMAFRDLVTRKISHSLHPYYLTLVTISCVMLSGFIFGAITGFDGWHMLTARQFTILCLSALFITSSFLLVIISVQNGELSFVAPFSFSGAIFGVLAGVLFWNEPLSSTTIIGMILITIAALVILTRQKEPMPITHD